LADFTLWLYEIFMHDFNLSLLSPRFLPYPVIFVLILSEVASHFLLSGKGN
jgi:hypothetical protein